MFSGLGGQGHTQNTEFHKFLVLVPSQTIQEHYLQI